MLIFLCILAFVGYLILAAATCSFLAIHMNLDDDATIFGGIFWPLAWVLLFIHFLWSFIQEVWSWN